MRKLAYLAGLLVIISMAGCFGDEECAGDDCTNTDEGVTLAPGDEQVEDPAPEKQKEQEQEPAAQEQIVFAEPVPVSQWAQDKLEVVNTKWEAPETVTPDDLTAEDQLRIDTLRKAVEVGLDVGKTRYVESVSMSLASLGVIADYEGAVSDGFAELTEPVVECPFAKYYDNGFEPSGYTCEYLVEMAKVDAFSKLTKALGESPLPQDILTSKYAEEALFWHEQGAVSGLEEQRVLVRTDLKQKGLCNKKPTPVQSSHDKGIIVGRQLLANKINAWLSSKGQVADYPTMSKPIQVCNIDQSMLLPTRQDAYYAVDATIAGNPLCLNYAPPNQEAMFQYGQAEIDYEAGIKMGIEEEYALAAVRVFKVIPCNVSDPIVVDLDGDGFEMLPVNSGVDFDLYGFGEAVATAWVSPDDGLLVMDANSNGMVDDGTELFGNIDSAFADGFEHLAGLDQRAAGGNLDGMLTPQDAGFRYLAVWKDADGNGRSAPSELIPLANLKIDSIRLQAVDSSLRVAGTRIARVSTMGAFACGDAYLNAAPYARLTK